MYDGSVEVARFPDFSPMRKLEIRCEIYFGRSVLIVFSGGNRLLGVADAGSAGAKAASRIGPDRFHLHGYLLRPHDGFPPARSTTFIPGKKASSRLCEERNRAGGFLVRAGEKRGWLDLAETSPRGDEFKAHDVSPHAG
jgi:hypothetical protein